jgi:hypothetical protein
VTVVGGTEFHFGNLVRESDGEVSLRMVGPAGVWLVQRSLDLQSWETVRTITNTAGLLEFTDVPVTNVTQRFYRAVKQ